MHELAITRAIVEQCIERCEGQRVVRVLIEIGLASAVVPDAVRFAFPLCAEGTLLDGARLEIRTPPGEALLLKEMEVTES